jgi:hypothetical protein
MNSLRQNINEEPVNEQESAVEGIHSRWSSSSQVIVDRLPSQPLSRHQSQQGSATKSLQGSNSKWTSGSEVIVDRLPSQPLSRHQSRRGSASGRLQRSVSKQTSGSGVIIDSSTLQSLSRRRSAVGRLELCGSRWSSGSQASDARSPLKNRVTKQCHGIQKLNYDEESHLTLQLDLSAS